MKAGKAISPTPTRERVPDDQPPAKAWQMLAPRGQRAGGRQPVR